jgi:hypothetical protein
VLKQRVKNRQIRGLHHDAIRQGNPFLAVDQSQHRLGGDGRPHRRQLAQRVLHAFLSFVLRRLQNPQVLFHRWQFLVGLAQLVIGPTKGQRGIQMLHVTVLAKRVGLADQRVDHVTVVDQRLPLAKLSG